MQYSCPYLAFPSSQFERQGYTLYVSSKLIYLQGVIVVFYMLSYKLHTKPVNTLESQLWKAGIGQRGFEYQASC